MNRKNYIAINAKDISLAPEICKICEYDLYFKDRNTIIIGYDNTFIYDFIFQLSRIYSHLPFWIIVMHEQYNFSIMEQKNPMSCGASFNIQNGDIITVRPSYVFETEDMFQKAIKLFKAFLPI